MTRRMLVLSSVFALLSGCLSDEPSQLSGTVLGCQTDSDCIGGMQCTTEGFCKEGRAVCGDGVVDSAFGETCDDGNDNENDSCPSGPNGSCQFATCGDGFVWDTDGGLEECEPGVTDALSCQDLDNAEVEGFATCSDVLCRHNKTECFDGPPGFVRIEAGTFIMGSPESEFGHQIDESRHQVTLTHDFYLAEHEVTQGQWQTLIGNNPSRNNNGFCDTCPVENVNWWEAIHYANYLSESEDLTACYVLSGCNFNSVGADRECSDVTLQGGSGETVITPYECEGYRLPTEAEWEYAARSITSTKYAGSDDVDEVAWYLDNAGSTTHAVKGKRPNAWGLYDMSGHVWEYVWDWYDEYWFELSNIPGGVTDPTGPNSGIGRVKRGGGWFSRPQYVRVAEREYSPIGERDSYAGFRLARTAE